MAREICILWLMSEPTSTADYRKYPKGPNFGLIVVLFGITIIVILAGAWLLIGRKGKKLLPEAHTSHPTSQETPLRAPATMDAIEKTC
jgi:hypothetical protein